MNDLDKSLLEQYMQEELETMRQAFQIRLGQLEKRYKKQLIMEHQRSVAKQSNQNAKVVTPAVPSKVKCRTRHNSHAGSHTYIRKRRNSWHSYISSEQELDKLALPDDPHSESSVDIDSDQYITEGSDREMEPGLSTEDTSATGKRKVEQSKQEKSDSSSSSLYVQPMTRSHELKGKGKLGTEGCKENTMQLSPSKEEHCPPVDDKVKMLIQKKIEEYREKMHLFQEQSEAQICIMERNYLRKMYELKKSNRTAANNISGLFDVRTLV